MKYFTKEPIVHSHITDVLEETHPLSNKTIECDKCKVMVHASNNECMQTWFETEHGNYCTSCFKFDTVMEELEEALSIN